MTLVRSLLALALAAACGEPARRQGREGPEDPQNTVLVARNKLVLELAGFESDTLRLSIGEKGATPRALDITRSGTHALAEGLRAGVEYNVRVSTHPKGFRCAPAESTIMITKEENLLQMRCASTDSSLAMLEVATADSALVFDPEQTSYELTDFRTNDRVRVLARATRSDATMQLTWRGEVVDLDAEGAAELPMELGDSLLEVAVTAAAQLPPSHYEVHVTRPDDYREAARIAGPDDSSAGFGGALALSDEHLIVGPVWGPGRVQVYRRVIGGYELEQTLDPPSDPPSHVEHSGFGAGLAVSGEWLAITAPAHASRPVSPDDEGPLPAKGVVYLYRRSATGFAYHSFLRSPRAPQPGEFGVSLAFGDGVLVVAEHDWIHRFALKGDAWEHAGMTALDPHLDGFVLDMALIGARLAVLGSESVEVLRQEVGTFVHETNIEAREGEYFFALAMHDAHLLIGDYLQMNVESYAHDQATWTLAQTLHTPLQPPPESKGDSFGKRMIFLSSDALIVSAPRSHHEDDSLAYGRLCLYRRAANDQPWSHTSTISLDRSANALGEVMAAHRGAFAAAAPNGQHDDQEGYGAVYVFR